MAKRALVQHMLHGKPWHAAAAAAGLHISRATAYRLLQRVRTEGEEALTDRRHGHPSKIRAPARQWLQAYWHEHPQASFREAQQALHAHVGVRVSQSHLSWVRATLGFARVDGGKKQAPSPPPEPTWQEGALGLLLLAATHETGLLEALEQAVPVVQATPTSRLVHSTRASRRRLLLTLLFLGAVGLRRTWDL